VLDVGVLQYKRCCPDNQPLSLAVLGLPHDAGCRSKHKRCGQAPSGNALDDHSRVHVYMLFWDSRHERNVNMWILLLQAPLTKSFPAIGLVATGLVVIAMVVRCPDFQPEVALGT
jgi:hypothetical protein